MHILAEISNDFETWIVLIRQICPCEGNVFACRCSIGKREWKDARTTLSKNHVASHHVKVEIQIGKNPCDFRNSFCYVREFSQTLTDATGLGCLLDLTDFFGCDFVHVITENSIIFLIDKRIECRTHFSFFNECLIGRI